VDGFFDELQRRKVYRIATAYIIVAAGVVQLASAAFPAWDLPNWTLCQIIVLLLLGFPIALMLAGDVCAAVAIIDTAQRRQRPALRALQTTVREYCESD
jgi:hypothetical protein